LANLEKFRSVAAKSRWGKAGELIRKRGAQLKCVRVTTSARLHLGFLDLNGALGRRFGSIGLAVDAFETCVQLREAPSLRVLGEERERGSRLAVRIGDSLGVDVAKELTIVRAIPAHAGLGSGTQLAISLASAFRRYAGLPLDPLGDAHLLERGARSGVGAALFERGGLVVDAGRGTGTTIPPVVARVTFPPDWRALLMLDSRIEGAHGEAEGRAFAALPPFPGDSASEICRLTLMQILPGAAEQDFAAFGEGVSRVQAIVGVHFAPAQGGGRFTSAAVGHAAKRLEGQGARGIGQSSWGPTGFAFATDPDHAEFLARRARAECESGVEFKICKALDRGADICEEQVVSNP
jgi:beta-ribofuranosylaminobenzene 5'-phosphate synthase